MKFESVTAYICDIWMHDKTKMTKLIFANSQLCQHTLTLKTIDSRHKRQIEINREVDNQPYFVPLPVNTIY
uniref:Uncharacterized protein n=1 Tax=Onchocerca volvulus TaxID=6282 RepID=A0A8R1Y5P6_ONCVO